MLREQLAGAAPVFWESGAEAVAVS
jgi:hypothetical protein